MTGTLTADLADFALRTGWEDIPGPVRQEAARATVNAFAAGLGGASDLAVERAMRTLLPFSGPAGAGIVGQSARADLLTAAFLNAVTINVLDFDDTHEGTIIHPSAPVLAAVLGIAGQKALPGPEMLRAFTLGVEIACRLGDAVSPGHYRRGWHITSTCGVFGAAAAAGLLLGLDRREMIWALGAAAAQSSGLVETLGTMAKSVGVGAAARGGLLAAFAARNGIEGPDHPLEGPLGFLHVTAETPDLAAATTDLGARWALQRNMYKPYPCGIVLHAAVDACLEARAHPLYTPEAIARIEVCGSALLKERTDRPRAETSREAQVSAQHTLAVALARGTAGAGDFTEGAIGDPAVRALRALVAPVLTDDTMPTGAAGLVLHLRGGERITARIDNPRGGLTRPLSDAELTAKLRDLAAFGCPAVDPAPLLEALWALPGAPDVRPLLAAACP